MNVLGPTHPSLKSALRDRTWRTSHVAPTPTLTRGSVFPSCHVSYTGHACNTYRCTLHTAHSMRSRPTGTSRHSSASRTCPPPTTSTQPPDAGTVPTPMAPSAKGAFPQRHWHTSSIITAAAAEAVTTTCEATKSSASPASPSGFPALSAPHYTRAASLYHAPRARKHPRHQRPLGHRVAIMEKTVEDATEKTPVNVDDRATAIAPLSGKAATRSTPSASRTWDDNHE